MQEKPLSRALCRVAGHDPDLADEHDSLSWYATVGALLLLISTLAGASTYVTMLDTMGVSVAVSIVAAVIVAAFVYNIDRMISISPRLGDGLKDRLGFLLVRGTVSLILSLFIAHGFVLFANHDALNAMVNRAAATQATDDVNKLRTNSPQTAAITAASTKIDALTNQNTAMTAQAEKLRAAWLEDMLPCSPGAKLTCSGDIPGPGNISDPLKQTWQDYINNVQKPTTDANNAEIAKLRESIATNNKQLDAQSTTLGDADRSETGMAAQTRALITLLKQDPFLLLLPLVLLVLDMSVALGKALFAATGLDLHARRNHFFAKALARTRAADPAWTRAVSTVHELHALEAENRERERINHKAQQRARKAAASAHTGPNRRRAAVVTGTVVIAAIIALVTSLLTGSGPAKTPAAAATPAGSALTVNVDPAKAVNVTVPGVGVLSAPAGAFSDTGTMTLTAGTAPLPADSGLVPAGEGIDATFTNTHLVKAVNLKFDPRTKPSPDAVPVIAHKGDDGTWDYVPTQLGSDGTITGSTAQFSLNLPTWLNPAAWLHGFGNFLASAIAGRTSPLTCSGAPSWFHTSVGHSDLVHVCTKNNPKPDGTARGEIQLKSNRGVSVEVTVPGTPDYVWVENQSWGVRKWFMDTVGLDANRTVILPPGATMTVGYTQPKDTADLTFNVNGTTGLATLDTVVRLVTQYAVGAMDPTWVLWTIASCNGGVNFDTNGVHVGDIDIRKFLDCMINSAADGVRGTDQAVALAQKLGPDADAAKLASVAKSIKGAAWWITLLLPAFQLGWGNVIDSLKAMVTGNQSNEVHLTLDAPPAPVAPAVPQNPAPAGPTTPAAPAPSTTPPTTPQAPANNTPPSDPPPSDPPSTPTPQPFTFYDNYGPAVQGVAMCRGNPTRPESMPGGTVQQTFTTSSVGSISSATVQIDPDSSVVAHASLSVNGSPVATNDQPATGDVKFVFGDVAVAAGDTVTLTVNFTATSGKIITVYLAGNPGGHFTAHNSCSDEAPNIDTTSSGLRATVSGTA